MARKKGIALALTAALILTAVNPVFAYKTGADTMRTESRIEGEYVPGEAIICIDPDMVDEKKLAKSSFRLFGSEPDITSSTIMDVSDAVEDLSKEEKASLNYSGDGKAVLKIVKSDTLSTEELISIYSGKKGVLAAEPNYIIRNDGVKDEEILLTTGTDSENPDLTGFQYAFKGEKGGIDVPNWNKPENKNAEGVVVAVMDSGVDYNHEDLKNVMWDKGLDYPELIELGGGEYGINTGYDNYEGGNPRDQDDPMDVSYTGHGTHCAGIIAAEWNNKGVSGAANGARIMAIKVVCNDAGEMEYVDLLEGLDYMIQAKDLGENITAVNMSFSGQVNSLFWTIAIAEVAKKGIVCCNAAGNESVNNEIGNNMSSVYRGIPEEISVGAGNILGEPCNFSNYGIRTTHIFAPGYNIMSTTQGKLNEPVGDKAISKPVRDKNGHELYDDLDALSSEFTYEENKDNGLSMEISDGLMRFKNIKLGKEDKVTVETASENRLDGAVLLTVKTKHPVEKPSEGKTDYLIVKMKPLQEGSSRMSLHVVLKTKYGWEKMKTKYGLVKGIYRYCLIPLNLTEETDLNELTLRLLLVDKADSPVSEVVIDELWISDMQFHYMTMNGTSMASPAVAGEVAVLAGKYPEDSAAKRAARVLAGAEKDDVLKDLCITGGMANVRNSFDENRYTPVVNSISAGKDGLSIKGFFFGEKADTVVEISQGKNKWSSGDGSLSLINVKRSDKDNDEIITGIPSGMERNKDVIVTVVNKKREEDRQRFTRYLMPSDPGKVLNEGSGLYSRIDLDDTVPDTLANSVLTSAVPVDNRYWFFGIGETTDIDCEYSFDKGSFKNEGPIDDNMSRLAAYNGRILYVKDECTDENVEWKLVFLKGTKTEKEIKLKISGDRIEGAESWVYEYLYDLDCYFDLYYDGRNLLLFRGKDVQNEEGEVESIEEAVYDLDPDTGILTFLGVLNFGHSIGDLPFGMGGLLISHEEKEGKPNTIYITTFSDEPDGSRKLLMEKFPVEKGFTSEVIEDLPPLTIKMGENYNNKLWSGCGVRNGIYLAGFCKEVSENSPIAEVEADNFFFDYAHPEEGFKPCEKRIAETRVYAPLVFAAYGKVYFFGLTKDGYVLSYTEADTFPNYGDTEKPKKNPDGSWEYTKAQKEALNMSLLPTRKIPIKGTDKELEMSLKAAQTVKYTRFKKELTDSILDKEGSEIKIGDNKIGIKKVVVKNPKKAYVSENSIFTDTITGINMTAYGAFSAKKKPGYYLVLSTKGLPKEIKRAVKKANKQMKKEPIPIDILPFTLTSTNVKLDKVNKAKNKVKKVSVLDEKERKTKLKASASGKKDYKSQVEGNLAVITGTNNYDGEVKINIETGK